MKKQVMLTPEEIQENWEMFRDLSKKVGDYNDRLNLVEKMLDKYEDRIVICPASMKTNYHCAYPGGLVEHTINVVKFSLQLKKLVDSTIVQESLIMAALFHDLGKIGNENLDYYLDQQSNWHRERGNVYQVNEKLPYMPHAQRSLYLLQLNGISLTHDEFSSILIHDGQYLNENKAWALKEPVLAVILHQADILSIKKEKGEL